MKDVLVWLGLIDYHKARYQIDKSEFINQLEKCINGADLDLFADPKEKIKSKNNPFMGEVTEKGFKIKLRSASLEGVTQNYTIATGALRQSGGALSIKTEINGLNGIMIPISIIAIVFNIIILVAFLSIENIGSGNLLIAVPIILFSMAFMFWTFYRMMKPGMQRTKEVLQTEFDKIGIK